MLLRRRRWIENPTVKAFVLPLFCLCFLFFFFSFGSTWNTPSPANGLELMDGGGDSLRGCRSSKRLPCTNLEREEHVRDERLVLDLCGNWSW